MNPLSGTSAAGNGQRTLAAIVFTDAVGFSARMNTDEETTLRLFREDSIAMQSLCEKYEGEVLKMTGDGMLMYFQSAVQAVGCAIEVQKGFADRAGSNPTNPGLNHRIGIHLGDVFVTEGDVMGDGVNIAARLQAEAEPGGICISQTVYDVVKNKLQLRATFLGPRELKNIGEAVPVYKILLGEAGGKTTTKSISFGRVPKWLLPAAIAATVVLVAVVVMLVFRPAPAPVAAPAEPVSTMPEGAVTQEQAADIARQAAEQAAEQAAQRAAEEARIRAEAEAVARAEAERVAAAQAVAQATVEAEREAALAREREAAAARDRLQAELDATRRAAARAEAERQTQTASEPLVVVRQPSTSTTVATPAPVVEEAPEQPGEFSDRIIPRPSNPFGGGRLPAPADATSLRQRDFGRVERTYRNQLRETEGLRLLTTWVRASMSNFSRARPFVYTADLGGEQMRLRVWGGSGESPFTIQSRYGIEEFNLDEISPVQFGALVRELIIARRAQGISIGERILQGARDYGALFSVGYSIVD